MKSATERADELLGILNAEIALQEYAEQFLAPYVCVLDDGEVSIELIFDDFRIGFSVDPDPVESSWSLVTKAGRLGFVHAYGYLFVLNPQALIGWLIQFASIAGEFRTQ